MTFEDKEGLASSFPPEKGDFQSMLTSQDGAGSCWLNCFSVEVLPGETRSVSAPKKPESCDPSSRFAFEETEAETGKVG